MANDGAYTVLVYEDECGLWLKIPEYGIQLCTEDLDPGLDILEEHLDFELARLKSRGQHLPDKFVRTVVGVDKDEYGPTEADLAREEWEDEEME